MRLNHSKRVSQTSTEQKQCGKRDAHMAFMFVPCINLQSRRRSSKIECFRLLLFLVSPVERKLKWTFSHLLHALCRILYFVLNTH